MKRLTDRRRMLLAAGTVAVAAVSGAVAAQSTDITGTVAYAGGEPIPKGQIEVYLEDSAVQDSARSLATKTSVKSDGGAKALSFTFTLPASFSASPTQEIVAQVLREDGWLLARGSAQPEAGAPVEIVLYPVMY